MSLFTLHSDEKNFKLHPAIQIKFYHKKNAYNKENMFPIKIILYISSRVSKISILSQEKKPCNSVLALDVLKKLFFKSKYFGYKTAFQPNL